MSIHADIQEMLYDYLAGDISPDERRRIETHLAGCDVCARELEDLKSFKKLSQAGIKVPSDNLPQEYWQGFATAVEKRITVPVKKPVYRSEKWWDPVLSFIRFRPRLAAALGTSAAVLAITFSFIVFIQKDTPQLGLANIRDVLTEPVNVDERVGQYLKKSKVLLVGLSNMEAGEMSPEDLDEERTVSRQLADEARYLSQQSIDVHAARLIRDLAKVQEDLAGVSSYDENNKIHLIRQDINHNNLLFKVRMAESVYGNARFVSTGAKGGGK